MTLRTALEAIDMDETVRLLQALVRIPSPAGDEGRIAAFAEEYAGARGLAVRRDPHHNVLITLGGAEPGPTTLFLAHFDSSGPGTMTDPYEAAVADGASYGKSGPVVRGLGAGAPTASGAAMRGAAAAARRLGFPRRGTVLVAIVTKDNYVNHDGPRELLGDLAIEVDQTIAGEPTENRIVLGARGINQIQIALSGTPTHRGRPAGGANPIYALIEVLDAIERLDLPTDPILGPATVAAFDIRCDVASPRTPGRVAVSVDRRTLPAEQGTAAVDAIRQAVERAVAGRPGVSVTVELTRALHSWRTAPDSPIVRYVGRVAREALGLELETAFIPFGSNVGYAIAERGWPGIALGPGNIADIGDQEHVAIASVERATRLYTALMAHASPGGSE
ncbi:MAG: succinyl-diaminopimelate desuccinylase [Chloroflexota bacterium]|nr:succinyl-diaminopimelate desuccinylase [Chloroflexota bacterium]